MALIVAVAFLGGVVGWRIAQPSHPSTGSADVGFLFDMIDHHAGGADMPDAAARLAHDPDVKELAARMAKVQRQEIGEMIAATKRAGITIPPDGVTWDVYGAHETGEMDHAEQP